MFDHVTIRASDPAASDRFYTTVLAVLGLEPNRSELGTEWGDFSINTDGGPVTRNLHIAFFADTSDLVDAFHRAGVDAGFADDGAPGARPQYGPDYYGGFLRDPDGNSVEAVTGTRARTTGAVDHLWLRSNDLAAVKAFYETQIKRFRDKHADPAPVALRDPKAIPSGMDLPEVAAWTMVARTVMNLDETVTKE